MDHVKHCEYVLAGGNLRAGHGNVLNSKQSFFDAKREGVITSEWTTESSCLALHPFHYQAHWCNGGGGGSKEANSSLDVSLLLPQCWVALPLVSPFS